jgi:hypothetical protein
MLAAQISVSCTDWYTARVGCHPRHRPEPCCPVNFFRLMEAAIAGLYAFVCCGHRCLYIAAIAVGASGKAAPLSH